MFLPGPLPLGVGVGLLLLPSPAADVPVFTGESRGAADVVLFCCCCLAVLPCCALGGCGWSGGPNVWGGRPLRFFGDGFF